MTRHLGDSRTGGTSSDLADFLASRLNEEAARVLRDIEAKRAIVTRWEFAVNQVAVHAVNGNAAESEAWDKIAGALELDVRSLTAIYGDHPDYQPKWKP